MLRSTPDGFFDSDLDETVEAEDFGREIPFVLQESVPFATSSVVGIESILGNLSLNQISSAQQNYSTTRSHRSYDQQESSEFFFEQSNSYNLIIDPSSTVAKPILLYASPMKLIEHLTTTLDYKLMDDFLVALEAFVEPLWFAECLLSLLKKAFRISATNWLVSADMVEVMKMRCLVILQHWHSNVAASFTEQLPIEVRKAVLNGLDTIWTQARTLTDGDKRLITKVRRLYDPSCEHSTATAASENDANHSYCDAESDVGADQLTLNHPKWSTRIKAKLKAIFGRSAHEISPCSSLLMTSFSSDIEDRDNEACQILLRERSKNLAVILMAVEADLLSSIERAEVVLFAKCRDCPVKLAATCPNLQRSIDHFNSMCRWFAHVLTTQPDAQTAAALLAKLIRLAIKCMLRNNFNSFLQIVLALQSPVVANLTEMWECLPTWEQRLTRDLTAFGSPARNFKNIRRAMDEVFDGNELYSGPGVPIPFTGLFLSDSVYNWEQQDDQLQSLPRHVPKPLPVYKCHVASKILRQFRQFKQAALTNTVNLSSKQRALYSFFADIGRLGGDFLEL